MKTIDTYLVTITIISLYISDGIQLLTEHYSQG